MGTTSRGYPYPEGTDYVASGDDAFEALAQAVNADVSALVAAHADAGVVIARADSGGGVGADSILDFPGERVRLVGFTYAAGTLTYDGPPRTFIVDAEVQISSSGPGVLSVVHLRLNGSNFASSYDALSVTGGATLTRSVAHRITSPVRISTGDTLDVVPTAAPAGNLDVCGLRIYPIGPAA